MIWIERYIGLIDFEDDPAAHLPLPLCQVRDVLCYVHSTAWILARVQALPQAQAAWQQALAQWSPPVQQALAATQQRLSLLGKLPRSRRLGRDALRLRMAMASNVQAEVRFQMHGVRGSLRHWHV